MSDLLYRKELLRLAADACGAGRLSAPDATGHAFNPACGDRVTAQLTLASGRIVEFAHETKACVLAQASAAILSAALKNATADDVQKLRAAVERMLDASSPPPDAPFAAYSVFDGAVDYRSRHRCVLLPIDAALDALGRATK
jgi:NifU-like protein involved in Fe-S cluster formation